MKESPATWPPRCEPRVLQIRQTVFIDKSVKRRRLPKPAPFEVTGIPSNSSCRAPQMLSPWVEYCRGLSQTASRFQSSICGYVVEKRQSYSVAARLDGPNSPGILIQHESICLSIAILTIRLAIRNLSYISSSQTYALRHPHRLDTILRGGNRGSQNEPCCRRCS